MQEMWLQKQVIMSITKRSSCPDKSESLGFNRIVRMKFDNVTQWVKVPHEQSLASSSLVKSTGKTVRRRSDAG